MLKILAVLPAALFTTMMAQQPAQAPTVPADAAAVTNPVKPTPESLAHAKTLYGIDGF